MASLPELQERFALDLAHPARAVSPGLAIYRNAIASNYRRALGATFPVVKELVGAPFFHAAVDEFVAAHPPACGDLNVYGDRFGDFLAGYAPACALAYLPDVARLEWAIDAAGRAAASLKRPADLVAALAGLDAEDIPACRLALDASCALLASPHPVLRIWQFHQPGEPRESFDLEAPEPDRLLVRREGERVSIERLAPAELAWLGALAAGLDLAAAAARAEEADAEFDLGAALAARIADGTLTDLKETA